MIAHRAALSFDTFGLNYLCHARVAIFWVKLWQFGVKFGLSCDRSGVKFGLSCDSLGYSLPSWRSRPKRLLIPRDKTNDLIRYGKYRKVFTLYSKTLNKPARPSGILCTANEADMNIPFFPPKATPIPIPSDNEWSVITKMIRIIRWAFTPWDSSGVYICKSIVNHLRHGNSICKSEGNYLVSPLA